MVKDEHSFIKYFPGSALLPTLLLLGLWRNQC